MCELFAFSSATPTAVRISFAELAAHGGGTGPHADGWGSAFYQDRDAVIVREPSAAHGSACMQFMLDHAVRSRTVIAHVRKAIRGERSLVNTQPFSRELGGRLHVFAHNGMLPGVERLRGRAAARFMPMGATDSEEAFCILLDRLRLLWEGAASLPSLAARRRVIAEFAAELRELGPANFIYSDADLLFAHAHRRTQADGVIRPPGLHWRCVDCAAAQEEQLAGVNMEQQMLPQPLALIASVPLSAEPWLPLQPGELIVLQEGRRLA